MNNIYYDTQADTWHFKMNKSELKEFNVTAKTVQTGEFDIQGIINLFCKNSGEKIEKGVIEMSAVIGKESADFTLKIKMMEEIKSIDDLGEMEIEDIFGDLSDEELNELIDTAEEMVEKGKKKQKNTYWSYSFETLNYLIPAVKNLPPMKSTLIKLKGTYYLYGKGNNPLSLSECGTEEEMTKMKAAYYKEHGTLIIKDNAIEKLKCL